MKKAAAIVALALLLIVAVLAIRIVDFALSDPPSLDVQLRSLTYIGTPVVARSKRGASPSVTILRWLDADEFVVQGYVRPGKNDGDQLWVSINCFNRRGTASFQETFYDGEPDARGGRTLTLGVTASDSSLCGVNAIASPRSYVADPSDNRRATAGVSLFCPSGCALFEPTQRQ